MPSITIRAWLYLVAAGCVVAGIVWGVMAIRAGGHDACEREHRIAEAKAAQASHQRYLAEVNRGEAISRTLAQTQRRLDETTAEYITYANAITGVFDPSVRVLVEYASGAKNGMPEAAGASAATAPSESSVDRAGAEAVARAIGQNIAVNFARLDQCVAGYNALIDWHRPQEVVAP